MKKSNKSSRTHMFTVDTDGGRFFKSVFRCFSGEKDWTGWYEVERRSYYRDGIIAVGTYENATEIVIGENMGKTLLHCVSEHLGNNQEEQLYHWFTAPIREDESQLARTTDDEPVEVVGVSDGKILVRYVEWKDLEIVPRDHKDIIPLGAVARAIISGRNYV